MENGQRIEMEEMFNSSDVEAIKRKLEFYSNHGCYQDFAHLAGCAKIVFPNKFSELIAPIVTDRIWNNLSVVVEAATKDRYCDVNIEIAILITMNVLYPHKSGLSEKVTESMFVKYILKSFKAEEKTGLLVKLKEYLEKSRTTGSWKDTLALALALKNRLIGNTSYHIYTSSNCNLAT